MVSWSVSGGEKKALPARYSAWRIGSEDLNDVQLPLDERTEELFSDTMGVEGKLIPLRRGSNHIIVGIPAGTRPVQRVPFRKALEAESI